MSIPEKKLFDKYSKSKISFYNMYPTQSNWIDIKNSDIYIKNLANIYKENIIPSLYLHFPFCPKQCYFCHCYTVISKAEDHYREVTEIIHAELENLFKIIQTKLGKNKIPVNDVHFGGGTPTVIPMDQFANLMKLLKKYIDKDTLKEIAIEVDPRNGMTEQKLLEYSNLGIDRISFGVQDFDQDVQKAVNRINSFEMIDSLLTKKVRNTFKSINFDFIYGLPKQNKKTIKETREKVIKLNPSRIHFLPLEHRPDVYKHQNAYKEEDLPDMYEKAEMYVESAEFFEKNGYSRIGIHKFAKSDDILTKYKKMNKLYRNPNGFSPGWSYNMLAVGPSSIGKLGNYYFQNIYSLQDYKNSVKAKKIPIVREKIIDKEDRVRHRVIMDLLSYENIDLKKFYDVNKIDFKKYFSEEINNLKEFEDQGLLIFDKKENKYNVTEDGTMFINNICRVFDRYSNIKYASQREFGDGIKSFDRTAALTK